MALVGGLGPDVHHTLVTDRTAQYRGLSAGIDDHGGSHRSVPGPTLVRLWPELFVPRGVRAAWERQHPILRTLAIAA